MVGAEVGHWGQICFKNLWSWWVTEGSCLVAAILRQTDNEIQQK